MILPEATTAKYLASGGFRDVYTLQGPDNALLPCVLKVDNRRTVCDQHRAPWDFGGCDDEVYVYDRVCADAPDLAVHLARVLAHGPGWLIQERVRQPSHLLPPTWMFNSVRDGLREYLGLRLHDIKASNLGLRLADDFPVILDYACVSRL